MDRESYQQHCLACGFRIGGHAAGKLNKGSCCELTTSSATSTLLKAWESRTAVDSNGNGAGGKGQVDKSGENLHFDICVDEV